MATLVEITDPDDPRLADYRDLRDVELRKHLEAEHGLFLAEGEKVVRRAVGAGFTPRSFLMAPRWLDGLASELGSTDAPCYVVSEDLAEEVTGFHVHRGALASLERRPLPSVSSVLAGARSVLVLEDLVDFTIGLGLQGIHTMTGVPGWTGGAPDAEALFAMAEAALAQLPDVFKPHIQDVVIEIEEFADDETLKSLDIEHPYDLTGLYEGRPLTERSIDQSGGMPDRVTLYRIPILVEWIEGGEKLDWLVRHVLIHEIGHHFGFSDDDMHALEDMA